jgi:hypothetical protein
MQRELTYRVPYGRLRKLGRSASRKAYADVWLRWRFLLAGLLLAAFAMGAFGGKAEKWMTAAGLPDMPLLPLFVWLLLLLAGARYVRRLQAKRIRTRANFDATIRMTQDDGGLRFATDAIEFYLKWQGIAQLLLERDGVVVSHGNSFWLIPDTAFRDAGERRAFIQDVYGHLSEEARSISEKHVRAVLAG